MTGNKVCCHLSFLLFDDGDGGGGIALVWGAGCEGGAIEVGAFPLGL